MTTTIINVLMQFNSKRMPSLHVLLIFIQIKLNLYNVIPNKK